MITSDPYILCRYLNIPFSEVQNMSQLEVEGWLAAIDQLKET